MKFVQNIVTFTSKAMFAMIAMFTFFFTLKQLFVVSIETSNAIIAMSTFFSTFLSRNESTFVLTLFAISSKTISKISFFDISSATSRKQIFWTEIVSRSVVSSKSSRFSIFTSKFLSKTLKIASVARSFISFQTSFRKHFQKFYLIIDDLYEIFVEKSKRMSLLHIKRDSFISKIFYQVKITFYLKFAINQNKSITQNSKISNSKNFHQFMFAKSIRFKFLLSIEITSEKSKNLSYKMFFIFDDIFFTSVFCSNHAFNQDRKYCIQNIETFQQINQSKVWKSKRIYVDQYVDRDQNSKMIALIKKFNFYTCRRCFRIFRFNNDLHEHFRCIHLKHRHRRFIERIVFVETNRRLNQHWRKI